MKSDVSSMGYRWKNRTWEASEVPLSAFLAVISQPLIDLKN